jgi:hypothetical protein
MNVVYGPRRAGPGTYDAWLAVLRGENPCFAFTDPPFRRSLPVTLAYAATGSRPAAVLTGPRHRVDDPAGAGSYPADGTYGMTPVRVEAHPLTAAAALVWNGDLPRDLRQVLAEVAIAPANITRGITAFTLAGLPDELFLSADRAPYPLRKG